MENELEKNWNRVVKKLEVQFGGELDLQAILFLIGVQELGKGYRKFSKDEKVDVMHVAISTLLEPYGYYEYEGLDADGWPHWKRNEKLPSLTSDQQTKLMQEAIVDYFKDLT
ncbi:MAG: hypothetical protein M3Q58_03965 [Bacteroidota bacterium]|nr:hypothetical protein [Bacteroidota bacterium]